MKYVETMLDKQRNLRFTSNSLRKVEDTLGKPLGEILEPLMSESAGIYAKLNVGLMTTLIWGCLLHENPTLTLDEAGDIMDQGMENNPKCLEKVFEALRMSGFFTLGQKKEKTSTPG